MAQLRTREKKIKLRNQPRKEIKFFKELLDLRSSWKSSWSICKLAEREREREITTAHEYSDLTHAKVKKFNNTNTWVLIKFPHTGVIGTLVKWSIYDRAEHIEPVISDPTIVGSGLETVQLICNFSEITTTCQVSSLEITAYYTCV